MQLTPIYKFKKRELSDSPPDITANNSNWDVLETNLKNHGDSIVTQGKQIDVLNVDRGYLTTKLSPNRTDFNTVTENGYYWINSWTHQNTPPVQPNGYRVSGTCQVIKDSDNNVSQVIYATNGTVWSRSYDKVNNTWTPWEDKISVLESDRGYLNSKPILDPNLATLNGKYYITSDTNMPAQGTWVIDVTKEIALSQTATCVFSPIQGYLGKTYTRVYLSTWQPWQELATTSKIEILDADLLNGWKSFNPLVATISGKTATIFINIVNGSPAHNTVICKLPESFKPSHIQWGTLHGGGNKVYTIAIYDDGTLRISGFSQEWDNLEKTGTFSYCL